MNKMNNFCESLRLKFFMGDDFYSYAACYWLQHLFHNRWTLIGSFKTKANRRTTAVTGLSSRLSWGGMCDKPKNVCYRSTNFLDMLLSVLEMYDQV